MDIIDIIVPVVKVKNREIVFSDNILYNDELKNQKLTMIPNISEAALYSCIETILVSNITVVFDTIQYSPQKKTVYFYTNKEINQEYWQNHSSLEIKILQEIKDIFVKDKNKNSDCISIYEVLKLLKSYNNKFFNERTSCEDDIKKLIYSEFGLNASIFLKKENNELEINPVNSDKFIYIKENDKLVLKSSGSYLGKVILDTFNKELSAIYDKLIKCYDFCELKKAIQSINSSFFIDIIPSYYEIYPSMISVYINRATKGPFELIGTENKYSYYCRSDININELEGNEDEFFKRIFDCR